MAETTNDYEPWRKQGFLCRPFSGERSVSLRGSQRVGRNRYRENEVFLRDFEVNRWTPYQKASMF